METSGGVQEYPRNAYILLDAAPGRFETTMLHETGHVVTDMLAGGRQLDGREVPSIPHSTAALSDRTTAFSEGYAIHLETLAAHLARGADLRRRRYHEAAGFGDAPYRESEYYRAAADLTTHSQDQARYFDVRENHFAFESALRGPDYLRVQLERARGTRIPAEETISLRERQLHRAMGAMH